MKGKVDLKQKKNRDLIIICAFKPQFPFSKTHLLAVFDVDFLAALVLYDSEPYADLICNLSYAAATIQTICGFFTIFFIHVVFNWEYLCLYLMQILHRRVSINNLGPSNTSNSQNLSFQNIQSTNSEVLVKVFFFFLNGLASVNHVNFWLLSGS